MSCITVCYDHILVSSEVLGLFSLLLFKRGRVKTNRKMRAKGKGRKRAVAAACFHCNCSAAHTEKVAFFFLFFFTKAAFVCGN